MSAPTGPYTEVTQLGHWTWGIMIRDGADRFGHANDLMARIIVQDGHGWKVTGLRILADRKAAEVLRSYLAENETRKVWPQDVTE